MLYLLPKRDHNFTEQNQRLNYQNAVSLRDVKKDNIMSLIWEWLLRACRIAITSITMKEQAKLPLRVLPKAATSIRRWSLPDSYIIACYEKVVLTWELFVYLLFVIWRSQQCGGYSLQLWDHNKYHLYMIVENL